MTGTTRSSGGLDDRRKRLLFRCWHRGTREMDLILGQFADAEIGTLSEAELDELERLIEGSDHEL
ncbi:succinate dehydrogenase assembly factor 2, partial [Rhodopseudomonas sp. BR0C11]|uniref:succinate dehydrogenase assembly factor 2 n=1 Tax=Rhodopseudomonas sp. BR0C11 TaxID=2269370 RepID=UPI0013E0AFCF